MPGSDKEKSHQGRRKLWLQDVGEKVALLGRGQFTASMTKITTMEIRAIVSSDDVTCGKVLPYSSIEGLIQEWWQKQK